jgi:hypothetical protein
VIHGNIILELTGVLEHRLNVQNTVTTALMTSLLPIPLQLYADTCNSIVPPFNHLISNDARDDTSAVAKYEFSVRHKADSCVPRAPTAGPTRHVEQQRPKSACTREVKRREKHPLPLAFASGLKTEAASVRLSIRNVGIYPQVHTASQPRACLCFLRCTRAPDLYPLFCMAL